MDNLTKILSCKHVHFVGIGGVSTSALAQFLLESGVFVTGSDACQNCYVTKLQKLGVEVGVPKGLKLMQGCDLVVTNSAIASDNEEILFALQSGVQIVGREVLLGCVFDSFKNNVAVCGMHGKTTTSAMISHCLKVAGKDPTVFVGGDVNTLGGNFVGGKRDFCVAEACEYKANFLHMHPLANCILNLDYDHTDFYTSLNHVKRVFGQFANNVKRGGINFVNGDDENLRHIEGVSFGLGEGNRYTAKNLVQSKGRYVFDVYKQGAFLTKVSLNVCGKHNVYNALGTFAVCDFFGVSFEVIAKGLNSFEGVDRRCCVYKKTPCDVIVDYAHHPKEITAFLQTVQQMGYDKTYLVFQPHTYTRTRGLFDEFAKCLVADEVYVLPTYAAREKVLAGFESHDLVAKINKRKVYFATNAKDLVQSLKTKCKPNDVVLLVGAGDVNQQLKYF